VPGDIGTVSEQPVDGHPRMLLLAAADCLPEIFLEQMRGDLRADRPQQ
jgi:hypothetical protein